ncbi:TonB-dependent outer membrane receptor protein [Mizugakiibacter sediminis]|uniref:TonB-dependent outer membrane receptor protein n=1 Tax=Mizugakiibacter sediminis TaxID=1475481 RepID=A0A0K8QNF2_9GAMM|nr:TonB-dependent receptor [Mizugakiibacter sediminis]GAP65957.1 TonB-dependent outer membrane receptor protein [Mizugakiibacter sediminis]
MRRTLLALALTAALASAAHARQTDPAAPAGQGAEPAPPPGKATQLDAVQVSGTLDLARNGLSPDTGSSEYVFDRKSIQQLPLGDATPLNDLLLQAPGVVQDSFGELHVRGDHGNLQYRINGIIIPESISGFGQTLDTRTIDSVRLLTGALPAQYGYRTAGVVDITTKSGAQQGNGGSVGVLGGSFGALNPGAEWYGSDGRLTWYLTANYLQSDIGIENPTPSRNAIHDRTHQTKAFGYLSYLLNDTTRLGFMFGITDNRFEIPNNPDQRPVFVYGDINDFDSATLDERQREKTRFGIASLQGRLGGTDYQVALGQRYTSVDFTPDVIGDLMFNGVASDVGRSNRANTLQADLSTPLGENHTLRYGIYASQERAVSVNDALVFPADADGNQTSTIPIRIVDDNRKIGHLYGAYVQDEWQLSDRLTANFGVRADKVSAFIEEGQVSPRFGLVYQATDSTTLHAGFARYFTPPPTELIAPADIALFQGTTNQLPGNVNTDVKSERSSYYDVGVQQQVGAHLTLGLDAYYREVKHLQDEGQFGAALVFSPFNYARGRARGAEFTVSYAGGPWTAYFNLTSSRAMGKRIESGQYNFDADELAYIAAHWVHLDHDQKLASSGGFTYAIDESTRIGADYVYGSGLRKDFANTASLPSYFQLDLSLTHGFDLPRIGRLDARLSLINAFDRVYQLRDGSGIGVGAPQFGPRRGVYLGLQKAF